MTTTNSTGQGTPAAAADNSAAAPSSSPLLWNGNAFDRQRNNLSSGMDSLVVTANTNGTAVPNYNHRGASFVINVTAVTGAGVTLTAQLQGQDGFAGIWYNIPAAVTPAISAVGTYVLEVYPGISESANKKVSSSLPRAVRMTYTAGGTTPSFTLSTGANFTV